MVIFILLFKTIFIVFISEMVGARNKNTSELGALQPKNEKMFPSLQNLKEKITLCNLAGITIITAFQQLSLYQVTFMPLPCEISAIYLAPVRLMTIPNSFRKLRKILDFDA